MVSKHEQIIDHIKNLAIGSKISVRGLAKELHMSQGTIYRAIKEAEAMELVTTIDRVGTIRVDRRSLTDRLTFKDILQSVQGEVLAGHEGLDKELSHFIIGAMTTEAIVNYIRPKTLMIVGNRENVQAMALENHLAVLITGGFKASDRICQLAQDYQLPVISTPYDTYTVASIIDRSMTNQDIQEEILTVKDVYRPLDQIKALKASDTIEKFDQLAQDFHLSRFPVVYQKRLIGIVTAKDLIGRSKTTPIERVMTKQVVAVQEHMTLAAVSQKMTWEDIELLPVVSNNMELLGLISRRDVMQALQRWSSKENLSTFEDNISLHLNQYDNHPLYDYYCHVQAQMSNLMGTLSYGVLVELINQVVQGKLAGESQAKYVIESLDFHYFNSIQLGNELQFKAEIFNQTRRRTLIEVNIYNENTLTAKSLVACQLIDR